MAMKRKRASERSWNVAPDPYYAVSNRTVRCDAKKLKAENIQGQQQPVKKEEAAAQPKKRAITYEMAKNKGLTPHRSKEVRNPRVKMRKKFRKAQIRRKGQVRQVIQQTGAYAGELTGIRRDLVKSVQFKH